jgi:hypothetical protein
MVFRLFSHRTLALQPGRSSSSPYASAIRTPARPTHTPLVNLRSVATGVRSLERIELVHIAAYVESLQSTHAPPSVKLRLAALRMLFDFLVLGQIMRRIRRPRCAARSTRSRKAGRINSIDTRCLIGLRDRALILNRPDAVRVRPFVRVGAATMRVPDVFTSSLSAEEPGCGCTRRGEGGQAPRTTVSPQAGVVPARLHRRRPARGGLRLIVAD